MKNAIMILTALSVQLRASTIEVTLFDNESSQLVYWIVTLVAAMIAYLAGKARVFRQEKQRVYTESIQPILKVLTNPSSVPPEFNRPTLKILMYGSKDVAVKIQDATRLIVGRVGDGQKNQEDLEEEKAELIKKAQLLLKAIRTDVQLLGLGGLFKKNTWVRMKHTDFHHFYFKEIDKFN